MEASDIARITYELVRVKDDRMIMEFEDDRSHLVRKLHKKDDKIALMGKKMADIKRDYDHLFEILVKNEQQSKTKHEKGSTSDHTRKRKSEANEVDIHSKRTTTENTAKHAEAHRMMLPPSNIPNHNRDQAGGKGKIPNAYQTFLTHGTTVDVSGSSSSRVHNEGLQQNQSKECYERSSPRHVSNAKFDGNISGKSDTKINRKVTEKSNAKIDRKISEKSLAKKSTSSNINKQKESFSDITDKILGACAPVTKFVEVVRKRSERAALPGRACSECDKFYEAMEQQGIISPTSRKKFVNECSRHRSKWTPPSTPEGFWDVSLGTPDNWTQKDK